MPNARHALPLLALLVTACSSGASTNAAVTVTQAPAVTTTTSDPAQDKAACVAYDQAMHSTVDMVATERKSDMPIGLMSQAVKESIDGVDAAAKAATGQAKGDMTQTSADLTLLRNKITSWRSGELNLSTELTAVYHSVQAVDQDCGPSGATMTEQIPTK